MYLGVLGCFCPCEHMASLSTYVSLCVMVTCPYMHVSWQLHISQWVHVSMSILAGTCVSVYCVHKRVHRCLSQEAVCMCCVPGCLHDTQWVSTRETEDKRVHEDTSERICQWFLINPHGTQQMFVLISHRELCWFGGWALLSTTVEQQCSVLINLMC